MKTSFKFLFFMLFGMLGMMVGASTIPPEQKQEIKFTQVQHDHWSTISAVNFGEVGDYVSGTLSTHSIQPWVLNVPIIKANFYNYVVDYGLARQCYLNSAFNNNILQDTDVKITISYPIKTVLDALYGQN